MEADCFYSFIKRDADTQISECGHMSGNPDEITPQPMNLEHDKRVVVSLSRRQMEVLELLVQGCTNKQIAQGLNLATGTVKIHVSVLFHKLGVKSRTAAAVAGARLLASKDLSPPTPPLRST